MNGYAASTMKGHPIFASSDAEETQAFLASKQFRLDYPRGDDTPRETQINGVYLPGPASAASTTDHAPSHARRRRARTSGSSLRADSVSSYPSAARSSSATRVWARCYRPCART